MHDRRTPKSVEVKAEAPPPVEDPRLGLPLPAAAFPAVAPPGTPRNRLVTIGDSLTQGFQSGAIFNTDLSWPVIVAWEMGIDEDFRRPRYPGHGGLPLNIEYLLRRLEEKYGSSIGPFELPAALFTVRSIMDEIEDHWERGPGSAFRPTNLINHNLAVYGWDLRDALSRGAGYCEKALVKPRDHFLSQVVENANDRAAIVALKTAGFPKGEGRTALENAIELGKEGTIETPGQGEGIETLVVMLGANNALGSVVHLKVAWSQAGDFKDVGKKNRFTVWDPEHFSTELDDLVGEMNKVRARHVILATVPHVTIAPVARGVGGKVTPGSRYFPYYTRPWISDEDFDPQDDPCITEPEARAVDCAIDMYNAAICAHVAAARRAGRDWYVLDVCAMLDRLASRRYATDPSARPAWWTPYPLPPELAALSPVPDSRFFSSGPSGRHAGGLFSLDGVHPTTIGYGLIAQEIINVMQLAGVTFRLGDGHTVRPGPVDVDFARLVRLDSLISSPPRSLANDLRLIGWFDETFDLFKRLGRAV
jgi:hypothetical protein